MAKKTAPPAGKPEIPAPFVEAAFFIGFFTYLLVRIHPESWHQRQDPVFLTGFRFLSDFLFHPGGPIEYAAALLSQFYFYPIWGALIVTAAAWSVTRLTASMLRSLRPGRDPGVVHYIPALLLLMLHSRYEHPLSASLGFTLSLAFFAVYLRIERGDLVRTAAFIVMGGILYYAAAGHFLHFALMCGLIEVLQKRNYAAGAVCLLTAAAIPWLAHRTVFIVSFSVAGLRLLPFGGPYRPAFTPYLLYLFHPAAIALGVFSMNWRPFQPVKARFSGTWIRSALRMAALIALSVSAAVLSYDARANSILRADFFARHGRWRDLIRSATAGGTDLLPVAFQTNRALFHEGRLLEDLLAYPQKRGAAGLFLPREYMLSAPLQSSDFCLDLGLVNEARHWGYEALSRDGDNPWILKRLATVNFLNGDFRAAERCLNVLDKTLFFKTWSGEFRKIMQDTARTGGNDEVRGARSKMLKTDFICPNERSTAELDSLLKANPRNKMALEYRIAHELLTCRLGSLPKHLALLARLDYPRIPKHVEEVMLIQWAMSGKREMPAFIRSIRRETVERFGDFNRTLIRYRGDRQAAKAELAGRFGDTYWYYLTYASPPAFKPAKVTGETGGFE